MLLFRLKIFSWFKIFTDLVVIKMSDDPLRVHLRVIARELGVHFPELARELRTHDPRRVAAPVHVGQQPPLADLGVVDDVLDPDLPAVEYLLGAALATRAPVTLVLPLHPFP